MENQVNPYAITKTPAFSCALSERTHVLPDHRVPASIMRLLEETRAWIVFFSVMGFLLAALTTFVAIFMIFGGFLSSTGADYGYFLSSACYLGLACVFAIPSHFLWQLSYWIERATLQPTWRELEEVVRAQRLFWQVSGVLAAALLVLLILLSVLAVFSI